MDTNSLLANIMRYSSNFRHQKEFLYYHRKSASLESAINVRKLIEYNSTKAKYDLLKEKLGKYDMQQKKFEEKEKIILENIEKNKLNSLNVGPNKTLLEKINKNKNEYQEYLNGKSQEIKNEYGLYLEQYLMIKEKKKEEELLKMNEQKKRSYEKMIKSNQNILDEIKALKLKNEEINIQNENMKKQYEEQLKLIKNLKFNNNISKGERFTIEIEKDKNMKNEILLRQKNMRKNINVDADGDENKDIKENDLENKSLNYNNDEINITNSNKEDIENKIEENDEINDNEENEGEKEEEKEEEKIKEEEEKIKEEEEKLKEEKKEKEKNIKINQTLEDMCNYGMIIKKEIIEEKEKNPEKFIEIKEALKKEEEDPDLFALGLLAQNLEDTGIETAIDSSIGDENNDENETTLQFIFNGMSNKTRYDLHFDFGESRNSEILNDEEEYEKFKDDLKSKLSKDYNIPKDKIIVTYLQEGSVRVQVIFQSDEFNNLDEKEFLNKFQNENNEDFEELKYLKEIHTDVLMSGCKLNKNLLDSKGNNKDGGWAKKGEMRGNKPYDPPLGWIGIGLKVIDKYEDNIWIGMENIEGEWCVAYHGVARDKQSNEVKKITGKICKSKFKPGDNQYHGNCDDIEHPGKKVGTGVYCTPKIEAAEEYAGISEINGKKYKTVLMTRVKPDAIRQCECEKEDGEYWVVNGTADEIRPYRILYKNVDLNISSSS